jgi:hypothetical protein
MLALTVLLSGSALAGICEPSSDSLDVVAQRLEVTIESIDGGSGTVTSQPAGIACPGVCAEYMRGIVTLTAQAAGNSTFAGWGLACQGAGSGPTCRIETEENRGKSVTATFRGPAPPPPPPPAPPPPPPPTTTVTAIVEDNAGNRRNPYAMAVRSGEGPWTAATPTQGQLSFNTAVGKVGVAWRCFAGGPVESVEFHTNEMTAIKANCANTGGAQVTVNWTGAEQPFGGGTAFNFGLFGQNGLVGSFSGGSAGNRPVTGVPPGEQDLLLGFMAPGGIAGAIVRNANVSEGAGFNFVYDQNSRYGVASVAAYSVPAGTSEQASNIVFATRGLRVPVGTGTNTGYNHWTLPFAQQGDFYVGFAYAKTLSAFCIERLVVQAPPLAFNLTDCELQGISVTPAVAPTFTGLGGHGGGASYHYQFLLGQSGREWRAAVTPGYLGTGNSYTFPNPTTGLVGFEDMVRQAGSRIHWQAECVHSTSSISDFWNATRVNGAPQTPGRAYSRGTYGEFF